MLIKAYSTRGISYVYWDVIDGVPLSIREDSVVQLHGVL